MKERNYTVETAVCPHCGALCVNGHDDDGHIYCAKCKQSFVPKQLNRITDSEYRELIANATKYESSSWTAFVQVK